MKSLRVLLIVAASATLLVSTVGAAYASPTLVEPVISTVSTSLPASNSYHRATTCNNEMLQSGTYSHGLTVTGTCTIPDGAQVTIKGPVTVQPKATLNAITTSTVHIIGNVNVLRGALLELGCSVQLTQPGQGGTPPECPNGVSDTTVHGNITGFGALTMRLYGLNNVRGNITVLGGGQTVTGPNASSCEEHPGALNLPIKDSTVDGNITVVGWHGCWMGVFRIAQHGSTVLLNNKTADSDSMEIATNTIRGNLICYGNNTAPQVGDSHGTPNVVSGKVLGQCKGLS